MKTKVFITHWPIILLLVLASLIVWPLFLPGYFSHHDDLQVMRIVEMRKCFEDLQIPCRWVPDMGYGNGFPLFNYYGVFAYYVGGILSYIFGYVGGAKALFFLPLVLGGVSMYFLAKELFGKVPGFLSAILFMFAPYRALDSYVRGAIGESFSIALIPLVFFFSLRLIKKNNPLHVVLFSISLGIFLITHNIMTLFFTPFLVLWLVWGLYNQKWKSTKAVFSAFLLGLGISAFFLLPAFLEKGLVQTENLTSGGMDFRAHFVGIPQLFFDRTWGYGGSFFGPNDTISFQIGWPHWWFVILSAGGIIYGLWRKQKTQLVLGSYLLFGFLLTTFLMHNRSIFIWDSLPLIGFIQFPWRLLSLTIFFTSLLGGLFVMNFSNRNRLILVGIFASLTVILNANYFRPEYFYYHINDQLKTTGKLWEIQQQAGILDYLPKTAQEPKGVRPDRPEVIKGKATVGDFEDRSNRFKFQVEVFETSQIEIPVFDFPNWKIWVNGKEYDHNHNNKLGRLSLNILPPGQYNVEGRLTNTPVRTVANSITLVSIVLCIGIIVYGKIRKLY